MSKRKRSGTIRIVGGRWRGRQVRVLNRPGLRPSTDRARETLFNWLGPWLDGARCLDLFAGSGVLGLEALSRGGACATLVEEDRAAAALIGEQIGNLDTNKAFIEQADALVFLRRKIASRYDVVFLDPPYASGLVEECLGLLEQYDWVAPNAYLYLERGADERPFELPKGWSVERQGRCGHCAMYLLRRID